jgi:hypothetical protein
MAAGPSRIGSKRCLDALEKQEVVPRRARRSAEWGDALDHLGIECAPVERLLRPHRMASDQGQLVYAEYFGNKSVLQPNIVEHRNRWKIRRSHTRGRAGGGGGDSVPEQIGDDNTVFFGIERAARTNIPSVVIVGTSIVAGIDDAIVSRRVQRAVDRVGDPDARKDVARLQ